MRYALGAGRGRIVSQLFMEALVLAVDRRRRRAARRELRGEVGHDRVLLRSERCDAVLGEPRAEGHDRDLCRGADDRSARHCSSILPALKITGKHAQSQLRNLGAGGSTLRFGWMWTGVMVVQVALTVICYSAGNRYHRGIAARRRIRERFPDGGISGGARRAGSRSRHAAGDGIRAAFAARIEQIYEELERRIAQEPGVMAVTFGDRLPGMGVAVRRAEVEVTADPHRSRSRISGSVAVGPGFFEAFRVPLVAGRDFHDGDRAAERATVLVNEAFARQLHETVRARSGGACAIASSDPAKPQPWLEIIGVVRDIGMTPTDLGEAPYVFRAVTPATASPLVMGVRAPAIRRRWRRGCAPSRSELDLALRLDEVQLARRSRLAPGNSADGRGGRDQHGRRPRALPLGGRNLLADVGERLAADAGDRSARGTRRDASRDCSAGSSRVHWCWSAAASLAGNAVLIMIIASPTRSISRLWGALFATSAVMLTVGLLACVEPARRALRIQPTDALKEA